MKERIALRQPTRTRLASSAPARNRFRVAIVGNGTIFRLAHGPAWRRIPRVEVVATCDVDEERAAAAHESLGARAHYDRFEKMLGDDGVDLVDLCTPTDTHAELAVRAMEHGKHVICEKPMTTTAKEAQRMVRAAQKHDRRLFVGQTRRFDRRWSEMKRLLEADRIGALVALRRTERAWGGFAAGDWHWNPDRSGGVLLDVGVHAADMANWFMGEPPRRVYARASTLRPEARHGGAWDFAVVQTEHGRGRRALFEVSWAHPKALAPYYSSTELLGTKGKMALSDKDAAPLTVVRDGIEVPRYSPLLSAEPDAFVREFEHFLDCIERDEEPAVTVKDATWAVRVIEAARESATTGRPVAIEGEP